MWLVAVVRSDAKELYNEKELSVCTAADSTREADIEQQGQLRTSVKEESDAD